jgi:hypothetical protein
MEQTHRKRELGAVEWKSACLIRIAGLAETRAEGRARGEGARTHAEARAEGRRNVAEEIAAAGATAFGAEGSGDIGTEPVTAGVALRIDALHRETGQKLHIFSLKGRKAQIASGSTGWCGT